MTDWWEPRDLRITGSDEDGWHVFDPEIHANVAGPFPFQWLAQGALLLVYLDR